MARPVVESFAFRRTDTIGAPDATEDASYLSECFVDTGLLEILQDLDDPRRVVVGRTGSGKTALLLTLRREEARTIQVEPESLALPFVSNSTVLDFVSRLGVKLDVFFRLLWRHVFVVELLKAHFVISNATDEASLWTKLSQCLPGSDAQRHKRALDYLRKWGSSFWKETDYRIKELTTTLESKLRGAIGPQLGAVGMTVEGARSMTTEQKQEVVARAQQIVNEVQIKELSEILDLVDNALDSYSKRYFIVVDRLDENWVDDRIRHLLIRALVETVRDFRKVRHVKVVLALRVDLIERVFRETRDAGFQEEKYESIFLDVEWTRVQLAEVLDNRVKALVRRRYTKQPVCAMDVLPNLIDGQSGLDYVIDRTLLRPRDGVMLLNTCIAHAAGSPMINTETLRSSEGEYSKLRLRALADEWYADYPGLMRCVEVLKGKKPTLEVSDLMGGPMNDLCLDMAIGESAGSDVLSALALGVSEGLDEPGEFARVLAGVFYRVGLCGIKLEAFESVSWSVHRRRSASKADITLDSRLHIHPAFWRVLGINPRGDSGSPQIGMAINRSVAGRVRP